MPSLNFSCQIHFKVRRKIARQSTSMPDIPIMVQSEVHLYELVQNLICFPPFCKHFLDTRPFLLLLGDGLLLMSGRTVEVASIGDLFFFYCLTGGRGFF